MEIYILSFFVVFQVLQEFFRTCILVCLQQLHHPLSFSYVPNSLILHPTAYIFLEILLGLNINGQLSTRFQHANITIRRQISKVLQSLIQDSISSPRDNRIPPTIHKTSIPQHLLQYFRRTFQINICILEQSTISPHLPKINITQSTLKLFTLAIHLKTILQHIYHWTQL